MGVSRGMYTFFLIIVIIQISVHLHIYYICHYITYDNCTTIAHLDTKKLNRKMVFIEKRSFLI